MPRPVLNLQVRPVSSAILDFEKLCEQGGHFCKACQAFRAVEGGKNGYLKCAECGSYKVKWCPPVEGYKRSDTSSPLKSDPKNFHG